MFENIAKFFKRIGKKEQGQISSSDAAKERLHLVLMQDRANVSADFLDMMKQEIIEVIKKYIDVDEKDIDVKLTNKTNEDGTTGAPALYANIPIVGIKQEEKKNSSKKVEKDNKEIEASLEDNTVKEVEVEEKLENKEEDKKENSSEAVEDSKEVDEEVKREETTKDEKKEDLKNDEVKDKDEKEEDSESDEVKDKGEKKNNPNKKKVSNKK